MTKVLFYEKAGCADAPRQKILLSQAGYDVETRDLLAQNWTPAGLRGYFANRPVADWFDPQAEQVLSGAVKPDNASAQHALVQMMLDPSLIRGPLVKLKGRCAAGMDEAEFQAFIEGRPTLNGAEYVAWLAD